MIGSKGGLAKFINDTVQNDVYNTHCAAHKLELAAGHAFEKVDGFKNKFEKFVNSIYSFYYNKSFKRKETLMSTAELLGEAFYSLNYIFTIRWVPSEYQALVRIYNNYKILIVNLEFISDTFDFTKEIRDTAKRMLGTLQHPKFFTTLSFALDVLSILRDISLELQKEASSVIGLEALRVKMVTSIEKLKVENSKHLLHILQNAICQKNNQWLKCSLGDLDTCNYKLNMQNQRFHFKAFPSASLEGRKNRHWLPISKLRNTIVENLVKQINAYFPEGSFNIFDALLPANLPSHLQDIAAYSSQIKLLAKRFHMNPETISLQFSNLIQHMVNDFPEQFCAMKTSDPVKFWVYFMKNPLLNWESEIKQLISIVLTLSPTTSEVERAFSILSHVLTNRRRSLSDKHVEDIIRIRCNGPPIKDFDPTTYVIHWINKGHILSDANNINNIKEKTVRRKSNLF
jgi:hAT family C-terminal dimerisation region